MSTPLYMCQPYSAIFTFKHLVGDPMTTLKQSHPTATYSLHFKRGRRTEHNGSTAPMRVDHTGRVTWNLTKSFVCTVSMSTYDDHCSLKLLDVTLNQHLPDTPRKPTQLGQATIDLSPYFKNKAKFAKELWFPIVVGNDKCRLHIVINTEPMGSAVEDYMLDHDTTTIGSEDDQNETSGVDMSDAETASARARSRSRSEPSAPKTPPNQKTPNIRPTLEMKSPRELAPAMHVTQTSVPMRNPSFASSVAAAPPPTSGAVVALKRENDLIQEQVELRRNQLKGTLDESKEILQENDYLAWELETVTRMLQEQKRRNQRLQPANRGEFCGCHCAVL